MTSSRDPGLDLLDRAEGVGADGLDVQVRDADLAEDLEPFPDVPLVADQRRRVVPGVEADVDVPRPAGKEGIRKAAVTFEAALETVEVQRQARQRSLEDVEVRPCQADERHPGRRRGHDPSWARGDAEGIQGPWPT